MATSQGSALIANYRSFTTKFCKRRIGRTPTLSTHSSLRWRTSNNGSVPSDKAIDGLTHIDLNSADGQEIADVFKTLQEGANGAVLPSVTRMWIPAASSRHRGPTIGCLADGRSAFLKVPHTTCLAFERMQVWQSAQS